MQRKLFGKPKSEVLYDEMHEAIRTERYQEMQKIIENPAYDPNKLGRGDNRTALHTATQLENKEAMKILLGQSNIDTNIKTNRGLTPLLLAAEHGRMDAFEILIEDKRVDFKAVDNEDKSAIDFVSAKSSIIMTNKAKELLSRRNQKQQDDPIKGKLAILIGNSLYQKIAGLANLEGAKADIESMKSKMLTEGYQVEVIHNSLDILADIEDIMKKMPDCSVHYLQVLYVGE